MAHNQYMSAASSAHPAPALTPAEGATLILQHVSPLPAEDCGLSACHGRVLRQAVMAERDNPPFDRVCMDGIALDSRSVATGLRRLQVQATQGAGAAPLTLAGADRCIEVMTGAMLPHGTDCVIPVEDYDLAQDEVTLADRASARPWQNVQRQGTDSRGDVPLLRQGQRLGAAEVAVVASAGLAAVQVTRQPRVVVVSTGDELVDAGLPIAAHQIRRSNAPAVVAALQLRGYAQVTDDHLRDDIATMQRRLATHLERTDVLLLSGGVSKGKFDHVPEVLRSLGVREVFHALAQRPGKPLWYGIGPAGQQVFGLPGNPVSTLVCLGRYVWPALAALEGEQPQPQPRRRLAAPFDGHGLTRFLPVCLTPVGDALPQATRGSGDFLALAGTDGFIELPPCPSGHAAGTEVDFHAW
jgi:molybdopterin molybdotransferase